MTHDHPDEYTLCAIIARQSNLAPHRIARNVHENACNYETSQRQDTRAERLKREITELALELGLSNVGFNGDPRGRPVMLYLTSEGRPVSNSMDGESWRV